MPSDKDIVEETRELLNTPTTSVHFRDAAEPLLRALADEVERLRKQQERDSTCFVCSALLLTDNSNPSHCIDCYPTEEDRERWEAQQ